MWYTIASLRNPELPVGAGETFCFSMRFEGARDRTLARGGRQKQQEQELWLSRPSRTCQRDVMDEWTYRLSSQGNSKILHAIENILLKAIDE